MDTRDIVLELREWAKNSMQPDCDIDTLKHAADEIERLRANVRRLTAHDADHRYWEGRYRDEAAENDRLRKRIKELEG